MGLLNHKSTAQQGGHPLADFNFGSASALVDRIYEAAFVPEQWSDVLESLGGLTGAPTFVFDGLRPIRFQATDIVRDLIQAFVDSGEWMENKRIPYFHQNPFTGFVIGQEYYSPEFLAAEKTFQDRRKLGLEGQAGTIIPMPGGELAVFVFEKWERDGPYRREDVEILNFLHPHLARAGLMAARQPSAPACWCRLPPY